MHGISALVLLYICVSVATFKVNDADYSIEEAAEEKVKPSKLKKGLVKDQDVGVGISGDKKGRDGKAVVKPKSKSGSSKGLVKAKVNDSLESDKPKDSRRTVGSKGQKGKYNVDNDKYHEVQTHNPDLNNQKNKSSNGSKQNPRVRGERKSNDKKDEIRPVTKNDVRPVTTFEDEPGTYFVDPFDETHTSPEPDITMPEKSGHYSSSSRPSTVNINSNEDSDDDDDDDDDDEITATTESSDSDSDETVEYEATSSHKNREKENDFIFARIESTSTSEEPITDATVEYTDDDGDIDLRTSSSTSSFDDDEKLPEPERESERSEDCNRLFKALNLCDFYKASKNLFYRVVVDLRHRPQ